MVAASHRVCNVILCMKARLLCQRSTRSQIYKNSQTCLHATSHNTQTQQQHMIWSKFAGFLFFCLGAAVANTQRQWPMRPDWERRQASWSKSKKDIHTHKSWNAQTHAYTSSNTQTHDNKHTLTHDNKHTRAQVQVKHTYMCKFWMFCA